MSIHTRSGALGGPRVDALDTDDWWASLVELYQDEAAHAGDSLIAARHLAEAGRICADELGAFDEARRLFVDAHEQAPTDPMAARMLADLEARAENWTAVVRWLEAALSATPDGPARVSALARLGEVLHESLGDRVSAAARVREALERAPSDRTLLARYALLVDGFDSEGQRFLLERRLDLITDPARRAQLLVQLGRLIEESEQGDDAALEAFEAAFVADPDHPPGIDGVVRILVGRKDWARLVDVLADAAGRIADEQTRARLNVLAALVLGVRMDDAERARPHLGHAVAALADDPVAVAEIAGLYERLGLWRRANAVLHQRVSVEPELWYRVGLNLDVGLGDAESARTAYRQATSDGHTRTAALAGLRRTAWRAEDATDYRSAVEGLVELARDPQMRGALLTHLADIALYREEDRKTARRRYADALDAVFEGARDPASPLPMPAALEERIRLLWAQRNWPVLAEELERALERPLVPAARAAVAGTLAEVYENRLSRPDDALAAYGKAVADDPDDRQAHAARQRLLAARSDWLDLLAALEAERQRAEPARRLSVLTRIADVRRQMGDPDGLEATWREALDLDPRWLPALRGLGQLLHQHGRWRDLAELHRHELGTLAPDDPRRAGLLGKLAELHEFRLDQPDEAIAAYEQILALRPGAPDAAAGLERLYRHAERWHALAAVLAARAEMLEEPVDQAGTLLRLADVRAERLDDPDGALHAYEEALALVPSLWPAAWAIERLALVADDRDRLAVLYRSLMPRLTSPAQRALVSHKLAAVVSPQEAAELLEDALAESADAESAWILVREAAEFGDRAMLSARLARFAQLVESRRDALALWREAAENAEAAELPSADLVALWEQVLQREPGNDRAWSALLRLRRLTRAVGAESALLMRRAEETDDAREVSLAMWAAGLIEERRGMPSVGRDAFVEAEAAGAKDPAPSWLILDRALSADDELSLAEHADRLVELARRRADGPGAARHLTEAAHFRAEAIDDSEGALVAFIEAVRRDPAADGPARDAVEMLREHEAWPEIAELLRYRVDRVEPDARPPLLRELAEIQLDHLGQRAEAATSLDALISRVPGDLDARVKLGDLRYTLGEYEAAAGHYRQATIAADDSALLGRLYTRLGQIRADRLGDLAGAIEDLRRAVGLGTDERALGELARVYLSAGEADLALMAYQRLEKLAEGTTERSAARAGQVHALLRRGRQAEAIERLTAFREDDPIDPMLATLARDLGLDEARTSTPALDDPLALPAAETIDPPAEPVSAEADTGVLARVDLRQVPADDDAERQAAVEADDSLDSIDVDASTEALRVEELVVPAPLGDDEPLEIPTPLGADSLEEVLSVLGGDAAPKAGIRRPRRPVGAPGLPIDAPVSSRPVLPAPPPGPRSPLSSPPAPPELPADVTSSADSSDASGSAPTVPEGGSVSDVANLLRPDIDPSVSGSIPALASIDGADDDDDLTTAGQIELPSPLTRPLPSATPEPEPEAPPEVDQDAAAKARARVVARPLVPDAWRGLQELHRGDPPVTRWLDGVATWVEGDVLPGPEAVAKGTMPLALAITACPDIVPPELLALLIEVAPQTVEPVLSVARSRGQSDGGRPVGVRSAFGRIAEALQGTLGISGVRVVDNPERPYTVGIELADGHVQVVVGTAIIESADQAGRTFLLARSLAPVAYGTLPARVLGQRESRAFFGALFDVLGADFPLRGRDRQRIDQFRESLGPALAEHPRRERLEELAKAAADVTRRRGIAAIRGGLESFDNRLALSLTDAFGGALEMLRLLDFDDRPREALSSDDMAQFIADTDVARDLLSFAASEPCLAIRRWRAGRG